MLRRALAGGLPLPVAFWRCGIFYGVLANGGATLAAFLLIAAGVPDWLAVAVYFSPLPYNICVLVAVWNSAARWDGPPHWANLARIAIVAWMILVTAA